MPSCVGRHRVDDLLSYNKVTEAASRFRLVRKLKDWTTEPKPLNPTVPTVRPVNSCEVCFKIFRNTSSLRRHHQRHKAVKPHTCLTCGAGFMTKWDLKQHEGSHSDQKSYVCHECGKAYKQSAGLYVHKQTAHNTEQCKFICSICGSRFMLKQHLLRHMTNVHQQKEQCPICERNYGKLAEHMEVCGQGDSAPLYRCDICQKMFKTAKTLKEHNMYAHVDPQRYACHGCGKRFAHRKTAIDHRQNCPGLVFDNTQKSDIKYYNTKS